MPVLWDTIWRSDAGFGMTGDWQIVPAAPLVGATTHGDDPYAGTPNAGNTGGLQSNDDLGTAVILSLFSDARLPDYMLNQFGFTIADQHEWHGNTYDIDRTSGEEQIGSLLWILRRAPLSEYTCRMAEHFAANALQPLVRQKKASSSEVYATIDKKRSMLQLYVKAYGPEEREWFGDLFPLQ